MTSGKVESELLVVDASVVVDLLLRRDAGALDELVLLGGWKLHAPDLLDLEVTNAIRRYVRVGDVEAQAGEMAVSGLRIFPLERHRHGHLLPRVWQLRDVASAYDAAYLALAEGLRSPLVTRDVRLSRVAGHHADVRLV